MSDAHPSRRTEKAKVVKDSKGLLTVKINQAGTNTATLWITREVTAYISKEGVIYGEKQRPRRLLSSAEGEL